MDLVGAKNIVTKAFKKAVEEALGQLLVLGLGLDNSAKFGMELVGALTVDAALEVANDLGYTCI
jgi:hypothetical protein